MHLTAVEDTKLKEPQTLFKTIPEFDHVVLAGPELSQLKNYSWGGGGRGVSQYLSTQSAQIHQTQSLAPTNKKLMR